MTVSWYRDPMFYMYALPCALYFAFVYFYWSRIPAWRHNQIGRAMMTQAMSLAAVFFYICVMIAIDVPDELKDMLRALLIGGVTIGGALMLKSLLVELGKRDNPDRKVPDVPQA